jgi:LPXTG-motif cell wall-anchored protein
MNSFFGLEDPINLLPILGAVLLLGVLFLIFWKTIKMIIKIIVILAGLGIAIWIISSISSYFS